MKLSEIAQAVLLGAIAIGTSQFAPKEVAIGLFVLLTLAALLLWPKAANRIEARYGPEEDLRKGVYVEFYSRGSVPHLSVFRTHYNWKLRRLEVEGCVFTLHRREDGAIKAQLASKVGWRSVNLYIDGDGDSGKHLQYFYTTKDNEVTGITRMIVERTRSTGEGFFSDIQSAASTTRVVKFKYARLAMNEARLSGATSRSFAILKAGRRRSTEHNGGQYFRMTYAPMIADLFAEDSRELELILPDEIEPEVRAWRDEIVAGMALRQLTAQQEETTIFASLDEALQSAANHANYSRVSVAAAVVGVDGTTNSGINVENASYPLGTCAEQAAIAAFVHATGGGEKIAKVCLTVDGLDDILPCGGCLQRIAQYAAEECEIVVRKDDVLLHRVALNDLLPRRFSFAAPPASSQPT